MAPTTSAGGRSQSCWRPAPATTTPTPATARHRQATAWRRPRGHARGDRGAGDGSAGDGRAVGRPASPHSPPKRHRTGPEPSATPSPTPVIVAPESVAPGRQGRPLVLLPWRGRRAGAGRSREEGHRRLQRRRTRDIQIAGEFVIYAQAYDTLATEIAGGNPPDIIGPVGFGGANAFSGHWLDLQPLIDSTGYDTSQFESSAVDYFKVGDHQEGLPFAIYPSRAVLPARRVRGDRHQRAAAQVRRQLRRHRPGRGRTERSEGTEVPWDYDTARTMAMLLTVDTNNHDATQAGFDPTNIAQYGFEPQRDDLRGLGAFWGAGSLVAVRTAPPRSRIRGRPPGSGTTTACGRTTSSWTARHFNDQTCGTRTASRSATARSPWPRTSCGRPTA